MDESDAICADYLLKCRANGGDKPRFFLGGVRCARARFVVEFPDQMGEHFGVSFRAKIGIAILNQLFLERLIIFDHSVMHKRKFPARVELRMRIVISHFPMRGPASMTDTEGP